MGYCGCVAFESDSQRDMCVWELYLMFVLMNTSFLRDPVHFVLELIAACLFTSLNNVAY